MEKLAKNLTNIEAVFLDLDGTIYMGDNLIEGAVNFLNRIEEKGIRRFFLSNDGWGFLGKPNSKPKISKAALRHPLPVFITK